MTGYIQNKAVFPCTFGLGNMFALLTVGAFLAIS